MGGILDSKTAWETTNVVIACIRQCRVSGSGRDIVGRFSFSGTYDLGNGRVVMTKQYEKAHQVAYDGANQNDGMWIWGVWTLRRTRGGFHLWPEGEEDPTQRNLKAEKELPKPRRLKRGELMEVIAS